MEARYLIRAMKTTHPYLFGGPSRVKWAEMTRQLHTTYRLSSLPSPVEYQEDPPLSKRFSYYNSTSQEPLLDWTIGRALRRVVNIAPERTGFFFPCDNGLEITFQQLNRDVIKCVQGLTAAGVTKDDSVLLYCPNTYSWIVMFTALGCMGSLSASVHPAYTRKELANAINKVKCKAIFCPEKYQSLKFYENLRKWIPELASSSPGQLNSKEFPFLKAVIVESKDSLPGTINFSEILQGGSANFDEIESQVGTDDALTVIFTSGTTGSAKAALLTHHGVLNNISIVASLMDSAERRRFCNPLPLFHAFGLSAGLLQVLVNHHQTVFPSVGYDQLAMLKSIQDFRCTDLCGSPTMFVDLINHPRFKEFDISSLTRCLMGGNICTPEIREFVSRNLGGADVLVGYGATETSTIATICRPDDPLEKKMHTIGRPVPHVEMKIADPETGRELPIGQAGEVWIRAFNIFTQYMGDVEKTKEVITRSRWYKSGDLGTMDADGYFNICSRLKDLVIRGGENIAPIDVESILDSHPAVAESHVVGVPDHRLGEEVCAWIVLEEGVEATAEELRGFCENKMAYFKIPKYFVFDDDVPKTAIGKPQKNLLRDRAVKKLGL